MTRNEFFEIMGYFGNPLRLTRIEIEGRRSLITNYATQYQAKTGINFPLHADSVTILNDDADKWGREMRLYFKVTNQAGIPQRIKEVMTGGGRPGYDLWDKRVNSKDLIDDLFDFGFILGSPQDVARIRALIPTTDLAAFDRGFNAP